MLVRILGSCQVILFGSVCSCIVEHLWEVIVSQEFKILGLAVTILIPFYDYLIYLTFHADAHIPKY